jgi:hypothetical protein
MFFIAIFYLLLPLSSATSSMSQLAGSRAREFNVQRFRLHCLIACAGELRASLSWAVINMMRRFIILAISDDMPAMPAFFIRFVCSCCAPHADGILEQV